MAGQRGSLWAAGSSRKIASLSKMTFHCPVTQTLGQHFIANEPSDRPRDRFESVDCTACGHTRMVDWVNSKTIDEGVSVRAGALEAEHRGAPLQRLWT